MRLIAIMALACAGVVCAQVPTIAVSPASSAVMTQTSKYFTATLQNATNQSVTWLVNGIVGGNSVVGYVNTAGRYVAPTAVPTPAIVQVQARSVQYPTLTASVPVTVTPPVPTIVGLLPATIPAGVFSTKISGVGFAPGSVAKLNNVPITTTYNGFWELLISGTSPAAGTYSMTVTNPDGKVSNSASLVVTANTTTVTATVTPTSVSIASGASQGFVATVTNTTNTGVSWYVNNILGGNSTVGTVTASGLYTAPYVSTATTVSVSAISVANPAVKAVASASIQATTTKSTSTTRYNTMGVVNYVTPYLKPTQQDELFAWQKDKYDMFIGGASGTRHAPDAIHAPYADIAVLYNYEMPALKDIAETRGYVYEDMLLHMGVNYKLERGIWLGDGSVRFM